MDIDLMPELERRSDRITQAFNHAWEHGGYPGDKPADRDVAIYWFRLGCDFSGSDLNRLGLNDIYAASDS